MRLVIAEPQMYRETEWVAGPIIISESVSPKVVLRNGLVTISTNAESSSNKNVCNLETIHQCQSCH
jgi:hypothetical protein